MSEGKIYFISGEENLRSFVMTRSYNYVTQKAKIDSREMKNETKRNKFIHGIQKEQQNYQQYNVISNRNTSKRNWEPTSYRDKKKDKRTPMCSMTVSQLFTANLG